MLPLQPVAQFSVGIPPTHQTVQHKQVVVSRHAVEYFFIPRQPCKCFLCDHQVTLWEGSRSFAGSIQFFAFRVYVFFYVKGIDDLFKVDHYNKSACVQVTTIYIPWL